MKSAKWEEAYRAGVTYATLNCKAGQIDVNQFAESYASYAEPVIVGRTTPAHFYRNVWLATAGRRDVRKGA